MRSVLASRASWPDDGDCGHQLSTQEANRRYYAKRACDYDQTEECFVLERYRLRLRRLLKLAIANAQSHDRVLDACGGSGYASLELAAMGVVPVTVDISTEMLRVYESKALAAGLKSRIEVGEIGDFLSKNSRAWDVIVFSSALHHLDDYRAVLAVAGNRLTEGGVVVTVFDPVASGRLTHFVRYADYLLWLAIRHPRTFARRLGLRVRHPVDGAISVGRLAERHALSGIDDVALAGHLEEKGLEILLHERTFDARLSVVRGLLRLLSRPTGFSLIVRRRAVG